MRNVGDRFEFTFFDRDGYATMPRPRPPCHQCRGDGQVCNECERPGDACLCPDARLPIPKPCPGCGGGYGPEPRTPALIRFHWWCMRRASQHDRPGYPLTAFLFDWAGGRAADLHRWLQRAP
jgi:hypothetical protein